MTGEHHPCPTCSGPTGATVGPVCQTCGRDVGAEDVEALRDERNHWIGEAKRYERLYRLRDEDATRWFQQRNEARAALAKAQAEAWDEGWRDAWSPMSRRGLNDGPNPYRAATTGSAS